MCLRCRSYREADSYSQLCRKVGRAYSSRIETEGYDLVKWARRGILPFLQTVAGSHIASCKVEPGTSGCAIYAAGKHAGSPRQHATAPSPPGPRTRRL